MKRALLFKLVIVTLLAAAISEVQAKPVTTPHEGGELKLDLEIVASDWTGPFRGQQTFHWSPKDKGPSQNLQVLGYVNSTTVLADIQPAGSGDRLFWIRIFFMDLNQGHISQTASAQVFFSDSVSQESGPVTLKVSQVLFYKSDAAGKLKEESTNLEIKLKLHRELQD